MIRLWPKCTDTLESFFRKLLSKVTFERNFPVCHYLNRRSDEDIVVYMIHCSRYTGWWIQLWTGLLLWSYSAISSDYLQRK